MYLFLFFVFSRRKKCIYTIREANTKQVLSTPPPEGEANTTNWYLVVAPPTQNIAPQVEAQVPQTSPEKVQPQVEATSCEQVEEAD